LHEKKAVSQVGNIRTAFSNEWFELIICAQACCNPNATRFRISLPFSQTTNFVLLPTALVHASDLFGLPVPTSPTMSCRTYAVGLPSVNEIAAKLLVNAGLKRVDARELRRFRLLYTVYPQIRETVSPELLAQSGIAPLMMFLHSDSSREWWTCPPIMDTHENPIRPSRSPRTRRS
jgi:hypothetical protein